MSWLTLIVVLAVFWMPVALGSLQVQPDEVSPGDDLHFLVMFPTDAEGDAHLHVGDGRVEFINSAVREVEVIVDAPLEPGQYTAVLVVQRPSGEDRHEAAYTVRGGVATEEVGESGGRATPAPAAGLVLLSVALLRRHGGLGRNG